MTQAALDITIPLDVRAVIAAGEEPFELILAAAEGIPTGSVLELTAPFAPLPLYPVMRRLGFAHRAHQRGPAEWVVRFTQTGITSETLLTAVAERHPPTVEILAKHGFDLCCGGAKPVEIAARAHGVNLDTLLGELHARVGSEQ